MKHSAYIFCLVFLAMAPVIHSQTTIQIGPPQEAGLGNAGPNLPMRTLQLQVRQGEQNKKSRTRVCSPPARAVAPRPHGPRGRGVRRAGRNRDKPALPRSRAPL